MARSSAPTTLGFSVNQLTATSRSGPVFVTGRVDMTGRGKFLTDTLIITDAVRFSYSYGRALADTVTVNDVFVFTRAKAKALADSVSVTDLMAIGQGQLYNDTATVTDVLTRVMTYARPYADSVTASENMIRAWNRSRSLSDSVTVTDSTVRQMGVPAQFDSVGATDVLTRVMTYARPYADSVTATESMVRAWSRARALSDSATPSDNMVRAWAYARPFADSVTPSESMVRAWNRARAYADSVTVTESMVRVRGLNLTRTDSVTPSEAGTWFSQDYNAWDYVTGDYTIKSSGTFTIGLTKTLSDSVTPSESLAKVMTYARPFADSVTPSESMVRAWARSRTASDSVTVSESLSTNLVGAGWKPSDAGSKLEWQVTASVPSSVTTSSGLVTQWTDQSGKARHMVQPTSAQRPAYPGSFALNGFDTIENSTTTITKMRAEGAGGDITTPLAKSGSLMIIVFRVVAGVANFEEHHLVGFFGTGGRYDFIIGGDGSTNNRLAMFWGGGQNTIVNLGSTAAWHVAAVWADGLTVTPIIDGTDYSTFTANSANLSGMDLGTYNGGVNLNASFTGSYAEFDFYSGTTGDRTLVDKAIGWAHWTYGLQGLLPSGHPYKSAAP